MATFDIPDETTMVAFGRRLASLFSGGGVVYLHGDLGAGKTTLSRGILRGLGHDGRVKSPTFTLVEPYEVAGGQVFHMDLYRLTDPEELEYLGIDDYFQPQNLCLVEWPEKGEGSLPEADVQVVITMNARGRRVELTADTPRGIAMTRISDPD